MNQYYILFLAVLPVLHINFAYAASISDLETKNVHVSFGSNKRDKRSGFIFQCNGAANVLMSDAVPGEEDEEDPLYNGRRDSSYQHLGLEEMKNQLNDVTTMLKKMHKNAENEEDKKLLEMKEQIAKLKMDQEHYKNVCKDPCQAPFEMIAGRCIHIPRTASNTSWYQAKLDCENVGSNLIVFKDANDYAKIVESLKAVFGDDSDVRRWIGGSDEEEEDNWVWLDGRPMPRGSPFWGTRNDYLLEPSGGRKQNCAGVYSVNHFYIHDYPCVLNQADAAPICEYYP